MMNSCPSSQHKIESISTLKELFNRYGPPSSCNEIILKKDISLHEYQGGLYKYIPKVEPVGGIKSSKLIQ